MSRLHSCDVDTGLLPPAIMDVYQKVVHDLYPDWRPSTLDILKTPNHPDKYHIMGWRGPKRNDPVELIFS